MSDENKDIPASEWKWFGESAHFICGRWCRFHLATQIGGFLVSTVGKYIHPRHSGGKETSEMEWVADHQNGEEIGCDRFYETMVFVAGKPCDHKECLCGMPEIASSELDFEGYQTPGAATAGHMRMCQLWATEKRHRESQPVKE